MTSFAITPLTDHTGAEVTGLDFTQPVDAETGVTLNRAFADHHVLVMRGQHFDPDQFKAAAQLFGELQIHDKKEQHVPGHSDVYYVSNDIIVNGKRMIPGETFHTDHSNHPRPPKATSRLTAPVEMPGTSSTARSPSCMMEPLPNCFSIWLRAFLSSRSDVWSAMFVPRWDEVKG